MTLVDSMVAEARVIQVGNLIEDSAYKNPHRGRVYSVEGIAPCLNCNEGGQREVKIIQRGHGYAKGGVFDICPALTTSKWQDNHFALIEYWIRKLTPRECFRLMDVPEHYIDRLLSAGISNSQLYPIRSSINLQAILSWSPASSTSSERCSAKQRGKVAPRFPIAVKPRRSCRFSKLKTS